jgi:hypothetical protein
MIHSNRRAGIVQVGTVTVSGELIGRIASADVGWSGEFPLSSINFQRLTRKLMLRLAQMMLALRLFPAEAKTKENQLWARTGSTAKFCSGC